MNHLPPDAYIKAFAEGGALTKGRAAQVRQDGELLVRVSVQIESTESFWARTGCFVLLICNLCILCSSTCRNSFGE